METFQERTKKNKN
uniref:Uncharacterized protein n=1 Tax=Rhizophora mucronata TaxID=61149 RepID=A0A2P2NBX3_RHIMU